MNRRDLATELERIASRARRNGPKHRDPEAFHVERDQIASDIMAVVHKLRSTDRLD